MLILIVLVRRHAHAYCGGVLPWSCSWWCVAVLVLMVLVHRCAVAVVVVVARCAVWVAATGMAMARVIVGWGEVR